MAEYATAIDIRATPDDVFEFLRKRGFTLHTLRTQAGGHGCNEFVFERSARET